MYVCLTFEVLYSCSSYLKNFGMGFKTRLKLDHSTIGSLQGVVGALGSWSWVLVILIIGRWPRLWDLRPKEGHSRGWIT